MRQPKKLFVVRLSVNPKVQSMISRQIRQKLSFLNRHVVSANTLSNVLLKRTRVNISLSIRPNSEGLPAEGMSRIRKFFENVIVFAAVLRKPTAA